jgi:tetratricopeptide (TPR) repeat protein
VPYHSNKGTIAGYKSAIEYFQQAIQQDPKYALAHAGLADAYLLLGTYWVEAITEAKAAAMQALAIDPSLAEAHVALGHIKLWLDWDWPAAEREFRQGLSLDPSSALAHNQFAGTSRRSAGCPRRLPKSARAGSRRSRPS